MDEINTCEYRTCSCDKAQAESHQKNQDKFSHKFDTKWGVETGGPSAEPKWKYNRKLSFPERQIFGYFIWLEHVIISLWLKLITVTKSGRCVAM